MKSLSLIACCILILSSGLSGQEKYIEIDSVRINDTELHIDFHVDSLFDGQVIEGLNRGLTVEVTYQIELWRSRNNWFDQHVDGNVFGFKLSYNKLEERYIFQDVEERRSTGVFEKALMRCSSLKNIFITQGERLKQDNEYYIVVKGIIKPLSIENL